MNSDYLFTGLIPEFADKVQEVMIKCAEKNIMLCYWEGVRRPETQGRYWSSSRSKQQVVEKIDELKEKGALFLAACIPANNLKQENKITEAIPGCSWHQWGEAVDLVWLVNGKPCWSTELLVNAINGYRVYAEVAVSLGLESGFFWEFQDACHIQFRAASTPLQIYTIQEINRQMVTRFTMA